MKHLKIISSVLVLLTLAACDAITGLLPTGCTAIAVPAISLTVVDAASGASIAHGATVRARDGSFVDSLVVPDDTSHGVFPISLAFERAGVYQVSVSRPGYREWIASSVRVTKDRCHVRTAVLLARLARSS